MGRGLSMGRHLFAGLCSLFLAWWFRDTPGWAGVLVLLACER